MQKKLLKTFALLGAACLLASCGRQPSAQAEGEAQGAETQAAAEPEAQAPEATPEPTPEPAPAYSWAVEPTVEADDIQPSWLFRGSDDWKDFNAYGMETDDGLFRIKQGEKQGLIDMEGTMVAPCEYDMIDVGYGERYLLYFDGYTGGIQTLDESRALRDVTPEEEIEIGGTAPNTILYWVPEMEEVHLSGGADTSIMELYEGKDPAGADYVTVMGSYPSSTFVDGVMVDSEMPYAAETDGCVLVNGGKMVSDGTYEAHGSFSCGLIPMYRGGKWGYLDANGSEVFPCEYDGTWDKDWMDGVPAYDATYGTLVLCKDGACALYAADGTEIIPFGAFEALRPVYGDRLWAKQDGKWGVLQLSQQWAATQRERG